MSNTRHVVYAAKFGSMTHSGYGSYGGDCGGLPSYYPTTNSSWVRAGEFATRREAVAFARLMMGNALAEHNCWHVAEEAVS